jgi:6-phosphogluconolactonase
LSHLPCNGWIIWNFPHPVNDLHMNRLLIGTYTRHTDAEGIYQCSFDPSSGELHGLGLAARAENPSFLHRDGRWLYAVSEVGDYAGAPQGAVCRFRLSADRLTLVDQHPSLGADPCHLAMTADRLAVANYNGGNVALYSLTHQGPGPLVRHIEHEVSGPHPRQASAHPHGCYFAGTVLLVPDLGGDRVYRYDARDGSRLPSWQLPRGSGPRHLVIHCAGWSYVVTELDNTVVQIVEGEVKQVVSTLSETDKQRSITAEIALSADETCLYVSNRGQESLTLFDVDAGNGTLSNARHFSSGGRHPRHFVLHPSGVWLLVANKDSHNIVVFPVLDDGSPGSPVAELHCPSPVCIVLTD